VAVRAGAGVVRDLDFRQTRNAKVTIGTQSGLTAPFVYRPTTYNSEFQFTVTRSNAADSWTVSLVVTDDCGRWSTFVGGGGGYGPYGSAEGTPETL
jgi:hypothetical protein